MDDICEPVDIIKAEHKQPELPEIKMQAAKLYVGIGEASFISILVPAFPDNPEVIIYDDIIYVNDIPCIAYGENHLRYHAADPIFDARPPFDPE